MEKVKVPKTINRWLMSEKLLTIREVAYLLGINEKEVIELSEKGEIPAYKVGGIYLRFQKDQIEHYRSKIKAENHKVVPDSGYTKLERLRDFFYFYDFYILSAIMIVVLLLIISKG